MFKRIFSKFYSIFLLNFYIFYFSDEPGTISNEYERVFDSS